MASARTAGAEVGLGGGHHPDEPRLGASWVFSCPGGAQRQRAEPVLVSEVWEHRGTLHGVSPDNLRLLQLCPLGPQHDGFGGTRLPAEAGVRWDAEPPPPLSFGEIQAALGAK